MKKTPWFAPTVKPARPGLYQREGMQSVLWARRDGGAWFIASGIQSLAMDSTVLSIYKANKDGMRWRGLAKKP